MEAVAVRIGKSFDRRLGLLVAGRSLDETVELAYYVWLVRSTDGSLTLIDTGFDEAQALTRGIAEFRPVRDAIADLGADAGDVRHVLVSHLHWDHAGGIGQLKDARYVVGRREWEWTMAERGRRRHLFDTLYDDRALAVAEGLSPHRVWLVDTSASIAPGVDMRVVGGHTPGHAVVTLRFVEGSTLVLAGDLAYLRANAHEMRAPLLSCDHIATVDAYVALQQQGLLVPGHDPALFDSSTPAGSGAVEVTPAMMAGLTPANHGMP